MTVVVSIGAILIGLALGVWAGYAIGSHWRERRAIMWTVATAAFLTAWMLDLAGNLAGQPAVSTGSLGLMAGLLTGIKYGGFPQVRVWETRKERDAKTAVHGGKTDAPARGGPDAPGRAR